MGVRRGLDPMEWRKPAIPVVGELPKSFKMTEVGTLPEEWEVASLGELFEIQQGKALSPRARTGGRSAVGAGSRRSAGMRRRRYR
jgi:hypothetical protein